MVPPLVLGYWVAAVAGAVAAGLFLLRARRAGRRAREERGGRMFDLGVALVALAASVYVVVLAVDYGGEVVVPGRVERVTVVESPPATLNEAYANDGSPIVVASVSTELGVFDVAAGWPRVGDRLCVVLARSRWTGEHRVEGVRRDPSSCAEPGRDRGRSGAP